MPAGASPFVDDLIPAAAAAAAPAVDDGWASLGFSAAKPVSTPAPAAPALAAPEVPPTAQDYLSQLKEQQDAALLLQSNPQDQAYYEAQVAQAAAQAAPASSTAADPPAVVRLSFPLFLTFSHPASPCLTGHELVHAHAASHYRHGSVRFA